MIHDPFVSFASFSYHYVILIRQVSDKLELALCKTLQNPPPF